METRVKALFCDPGNSTKTAAELLTALNAVAWGGDVVAKTATTTPAPVEKPLLMDVVPSLAVCKQFVAVQAAVSAARRAAGAVDSLVRRLHIPARIAVTMATRAADAADTAATLSEPVLAHYVWTIPAWIPSYWDEQKTVVWANDVAKTLDYGDWEKLVASGDGAKWKALEEWFADPMNTWALGAIADDAARRDWRDGIEFWEGKPKELKENLSDRYYDACYHDHHPKEGGWTCIDKWWVDSNVDDWCTQIRHPDVPEGFEDLAALQQHYIHKAPIGWKPTGK